MLSTQPPTAQHRLEICPPERRIGPRSWWCRLQGWVTADWPAGSNPPPDDAPLARIKREFADATGDLVGAQADALIERLHAARSLRELWHLRTPTFSLVALQHSQHEANLRLARLNRHFPTRVARSGFGKLEARDMWP